MNPPNAKTDPKPKIDPLAGRNTLFRCANGKEANTGKICQQRRTIYMYIFRTTYMNQMLVLLAGGSLKIDKLY